MSTTTPVPRLQRLRSSPSQQPARLVGSATTLAVAAVATALSLDGGASPVTTRSVAAILAAWAILLAVGFGLWPRARIPSAAVGCALLLAGFAVLTGLSTLWAPAAEPAFLTFDRVAFYLALFALPLLATRAGDAARWADGVAIAIALVACLALAQRLLPAIMPAGDIPDLLPSAGTRLSYPLGYWNGLAIMLGLGVPLVLRAAVAARSVAGRGAALAAFPALAAAIYLTSSRGGVAVAATATVVFAVLTARRFAVLQALMVAGAGAAVAVLVLRAHPALVDGAPGSAAAEDEGPGVAALLAVICAAAGAAYAALAAFAPPRLRVPRPVAAGAVVVAVLAGGAAIAAADPVERFRDFKRPPQATTYEESNFVQDHLLSGGGSGRWQFWSTALDQFAEHPVGGDGAAAYAPYWAQHGTIDWFVRNAHSLWLETLAELGLLGLALLGGAFGVALVTGARRLRGRSERERATIAALLAVVAGFVVGASLDWIWQIPAIAMVGVVCLGLLVGPATAQAQDGPSRRFAPRAVVVVAAWLAIAAQAIPLLVANEIRASQAAAQQDDLAAAAERAASARAIQPWAASPHLQLALVRELEGDLRAAREHVGAAIERDETDWRLHLVSARLATKAGDVPAARDALREARRLNPRSPALRPPA